MGFKKKLKFIILSFLTLSVVGFSFFAYGRDPFMPLVDSHGKIRISREVGIEGMFLEGIIYSEESPLVVINGEVLGGGQLISGYTVLKVGKKVVILEKKGKEYELKLEVD